MENLGTTAAEFVRDNLNNEGVKAYLDRDHRDHDKTVREVTQLVEETFGEPEPRPGMFDTEEGDIRQELYDDKRSVTAQLQDIYSGKDEKWSKPYFHGDDPLHGEAVKRVQILTEAKYGHGEHSPEIWPIRTRTTPNIKQSGDEDNY